MKTIQSILTDSMGFDGAAEVAKTIRANYNGTDYTININDHGSTLAHRYSVSWTDSNGNRGASNTTADTMEQALVLCHKLYQK